MQQRTFPNDTLYIVGLFCNSTFLYHCALVCKSWRAILTSNTVWQFKCKLDFNKGTANAKLVAADALFWYKRYTELRKKFPIPIYFPSVCININPMISPHFNTSTLKDGEVLFNNTEFYAQKFFKTNVTSGDHQAALIYSLMYSLLHKEHSAHEEKNIKPFHYSLESLLAKKVVLTVEQDVEDHNSDDDEEVFEKRNKCT